MISIDSDILRNLSSVAYTALENINEGTKRLDGVVAHNDWNCAERDLINEFIIKSKNEISSLRTITQGYLDTIKKVSDKFDEIDISSTKAFEDVNLALADFFSVSTPSKECVTSNTENLFRVIGGPGSIKPKVFDGLFFEYEMASFTNGIKVCNYSDIVLDISKCK